MSLTGIEAFGNERTRQIEEEGYAPEADAGRADELARAAACYADWAASQLEGVSIDEPHAFWPWSAEDWKPESIRRAMEKSGALLAASFDVKMIDERQATEAHDESS